MFEIILNHCPLLVALEVNQLDDLTDSVVVNFMENRPQLHTLCVSHCEALTDVFLVRLSEVCLHIKHLNIQGCELCTDDGLLEVLNNCNKLTCLNISYCSFSGDILHELTQISHNLRTLKMVCCFEECEVREFLLNNQSRSIQVLVCDEEEEEEDSGVRNNVGY
jgi:F-box/leucine-rich repeat protein 2/20